MNHDSDPTWRSWNGMQRVGQLLHVKAVLIFFLYNGVSSFLVSPALPVQDTAVQYSSEGVAVNEA